MLLGMTGLASSMVIDRMNQAKRRDMRLLLMHDGQDLAARMNTLNPKFSLQEQSQRLQGMINGLPGAAVGPDGVSALFYNKAARPGSGKKGKKGKGKGDKSPKGGKSKSKSPKKDRPSSAPPQEVKPEPPEEVEGMHDDDFDAVSMWGRIDPYPKELHIKIRCVEGFLHHPVILIKTRL